VSFTVIETPPLLEAPSTTRAVIAVQPDHETASISRDAKTKHRLDSVDFVRGLVMVIMALDHVRFFLHRDILVGIDPLDLSRAGPSLFFTRWITHFCAPVFLFLAGTGAWLYASRGKTKNELSRFLITRGLWLILLEFTVIHFGWTFNFNFHVNFAIVLWALGCSMIALAALVYLPTRVIAIVGFLLVAGHNLLDKVQPESLGRFGWLWKVLHVNGVIQPVPSYVLVITYPLIPWIGVMVLGYCFGALLSRERGKRRKLLVKIGFAVTAAFVVVRAINIYGDPQPWTPQGNWLLTVLSFLNCEKYPPSLSFLLMTLGPSILVMAWAERDLSAFARPFIIFGRVPLFYYLLHFSLIHLLALALSYARYGQAPWLFTGPPWSPGLMRAFPKGYGYGLPVVYAVWIAVVVMLYPLCRWFAGVKARHRNNWLSYF